MAKKKQKFMRTDFNKYSKLGVRRKKKQKYRKSKGLDNKIRLKMKGHVRNVSIGFGGDKKLKGLVKGLKPILVYNLKDLRKVQAGEIVVIAKVGKKKKIELFDYAIKNNIKLSVDAKKSLDKIEDKLKKSKDKKMKRKLKRIEKDKKSKKQAEKKAKDEIKKEEGIEDKLEESKEEKPISDKNLSEKKDSPSDKADIEDKKQIKSNNYGRGN